MEPDVVRHLDLSRIPGAKIASTIRQNPNLRSVSAVRKTFVSNELHIPRTKNLRSLELYKCQVDLSANRDEDCHPLSAIFSDTFIDGKWEEVILHDLLVKFPPPKYRPTLPTFRPLKVDFPGLFPESLKRLQISGVDLSDRSLLLYGGGHKLTKLECLILHSTSLDHTVRSIHPKWLAIMDIKYLQNLRELYLSNQSSVFLWYDLMRLPKLKVLFLQDTSCPHTQDFDRLVTEHPSLRILAFTGSFQPEVKFPQQEYYGSRSNAVALPQLHIFVGKSASQSIRFPKFRAETAKAYPISEPLPQFLEREDIKPIFEGVWIAEKIKEAAKHRSKFYNYGGDVATSLRSLRD